MTQMINQKNRQALMANNKALTPLEMQDKNSRLRKRQRRFLSLAGLTLIEILVSFVILALLMAGLVNLFVAGKRHIVHTRSRMTGGELGKLFLDRLQMLVRQDTWNNPALNCLGTGACPNQVMGVVAQGLDRDYTAIYTINNGGQPTANVNRVSVTVNWSEPPP